MAIKACRPKMILNRPILKTALLWFDVQKSYLSGVEFVFVLEFTFAPSNTSVWTIVKWPAADAAQSAGTFSSKSESNSQLPQDSTFALN